jgi:hypothetical protein
MDKDLIEAFKNAYKWGFLDGYNHAADHDAEPIDDLSELHGVEEIINEAVKKIIT